MKYKIMEIEFFSSVPAKSEPTEPEKTVMSIEGGTIFANNMVDEFLIAMKTITAGGIDKIVIDMSKVDAINSNEIGAVINLTKLVRVSGGDLVLYNVNHQVEQIIAPLDLNRFLKIFDDKKEVVNHFRYIKV